MQHENANIVPTSHNISKKELQALLPRSLPPSFVSSLYYLGNITILAKPTVAIVGSRRPTLYGREQCYRFAKSLSEAGICVLSGGAIGIDTIANTCAFESGYSCAVIGSGLSRVYPSSNQRLFKKMASSQTSLLLSQFEDDTSAQKWHFPKRNMTIAALADFVLVIEGARTSGSLITAEMALNFGRDVGALPGPIDSEASVGTNFLIQNGAHCVTTPRDVLEILSKMPFKTSRQCQQPEILSEF